MPAKSARLETRPMCMAGRPMITCLADTCPCRKHETRTALRDLNADLLSRVKGLVKSGCDPAGDDGFLSMAEIYDLKLDGCELAIYVCGWPW